MTAPTTPRTHLSGPGSPRRDTAPDSAAPSGNSGRRGAPSSSATGSAAGSVPSPGARGRGSKERPQSAMRKEAAELGLPWCPEPLHGHRLEEFTKQIAAAYQGPGKPGIQLLSEATGKSRSRVHRLLRAAGVTLRPPVGGPGWTAPPGWAPPRRQPRLWTAQEIAELKLPRYAPGTRLSSRDRARLAEQVATAYRGPLNPGLGLLAQATGLSPSTIYNLLLEAGVCPRPAGREPRAPAPHRTGQTAADRIKELKLPRYAPGTRLTGRKRARFRRRIAAAYQGPSKPSIRLIALASGIPPSTIRNLLAEAHVELRPAGRHPRSQRATP